MAVLKGVGVGDSSATALAATITWMLKGILTHVTCSYKESTICVISSFYQFIREAQEVSCPSPVCV